MERRKKILVAIIAIIVIALFVALIILINSRGKIALGEPFAANFNFARQMDGDTIYYFSGSSFVAYDLNSHKTTPLTPLYSLPTVIGSVEWSKQGALISAAGYSAVDQLYPELIKHKLSPNGYYWWLVDFKTGAVSLLEGGTGEADVRAAFWQDDNTYVYAEKSLDSQTTNIFQKDLGGDGHALATLTGDDALLVGAAPNLLLYTKPSGQDTTNLIVMDTTSKKSTQLVDEVLGLLSISQDGSALVIRKGDQPLDTESLSEFPIGKLTLYDRASGKIKQLHKDFGGNAAWVGNDWVAAGTDQNSRPIAIWSDSGKVQSYAVTLPQQEESSEDIPRYTAIGLDQSGVLLADSSSRLRLASKQSPTSLPKLPDARAVSRGVTEPFFNIVYIAEDLQYSVYITQNPYEENRQKVMDYIRDKGIDPFQLKLKWYAYDGVNTGFYLPPDMQPVEEVVPPLSGTDLFDIGD